MVLEAFQNENENFKIHHHAICGKHCTCSKNFDDKFKHDWLYLPDAFDQSTGLWWLVYVEGKGMFCLLCRKHNTENKQNHKAVFNREACTRNRPASVREHVSSSAEGAHSEAIEREHLQRTSYFQEKLDNKELYKEEVCFSAFSGFYFIAKEELANKKIFSLLKLIKGLGVEHLQYFTYTSQGYSREIFLLMGRILTERISRQIQASPCYGVLVDDVTDISCIEQMVGFCKYVFDGRVFTKFIFVENVLKESNSANAETIHRVLKDKLKELGIDYEKLASMSSDGASVMMGKTGGLAARLRKDLPALVNIHCVCHRLALACASSSKEIDYIKKFELILQQLWKFFELSPKRTSVYLKAQLHCRNMILSKKAKKMVYHRLKKAVHTRWLSFDAAVGSVYNDLLAILVALSELSDDATAEGLLKKMKKPQFLAILYLMKTVLPILSRLSKLFQHDKICFSAVSALLKSTEDQLLSVAEGKEQLQQLKTDLQPDGRLGTISADIKIKDADFTAAANLIGKYIQALIQNLKHRFAESCPLLPAFSIFDPFAVPHKQSKDFKDYGIAQVITLGKHFLGGEKSSEAKIDTPDPAIATDQPQAEAAEIDPPHAAIAIDQPQAEAAEIDPPQAAIAIDQPQAVSEIDQAQATIDQLIAEWQTFKYKLLEWKTEIPKEKLDLFSPTQWTLNRLMTLYHSYAQLFPKLLCIASVVATIPVSNAWPERGASALKRVKTRLRNRLSDGMMQSLMQIVLNGPALHTPECEEFIKEVVQEWLKEKERRKLPNAAPGKQTSSASAACPLRVEASTQASFSLADHDAEVLEEFRACIKALKLAAPDMNFVSQEEMEEDDEELDEYYEC